MQTVIYRFAKSEYTENYALRPWYFAQGGLYVDSETIEGY